MILQLYTYDRDKSLKVSTQIDLFNNSKSKKLQSIVFQSSNKNITEEIDQTLTVSQSNKPPTSKMLALNVMRQHTILCVSHAVALVCIMVIPLMTNILPPQAPKFWIEVTISLVETNMVFLMFRCGKFMYEIVCYFPHQMLTKCTFSSCHVKNFTNHDQEKQETITATPTRSTIESTPAIRSGNEDNAHANVML